MKKRDDSEAPERRNPRCLPYGGRAEPEKGASASALERLALGVRVF
jgi:hypothetical protein